MGRVQHFDRSAGILMPVSSLPSPYGIGTFGRAAYEFADFVAESGHSYWQVLPLGQTSYGDSPYQSFSAFAGNPYFIDLDMLADEGLLEEGYASEFDWGDSEKYVDYGRLFESRYIVLDRAFQNFMSKCSSDGKLRGRYEEFKKADHSWLDEYSLYMACKEHFGYVSWTEWDDDIRLRRPEAVIKYAQQLADRIEFWNFCQYEFFEQWNRLKCYVNARGIQIIGDIPIYVAPDSADVWAHPDVFLLDGNLRPLKVAGVPPDAFTDLGQKWGNPIYNWDNLAADGFGWWKRRMQAQAALYDVIRIDHFLGIVKYYTIPPLNPDAKQGEYRQGPGRLLTDAINEAIGDKRIIAEDLGVEMPEVTGILKDNGYPGMKVLEFAFDGNRRNPHLPYNYTRDLVVYGGTHDNETLYGYFTEHSDDELKYAREYLDADTPEEMVRASFRAAYASVADTVIFQVQDILCLDNSARINTPSTMGDNWRWRLAKGQLTSEHARNMRHLAGIYGRINNE